MPQEKVISLQIEGGEAKPGPPLGPTLSSLGLNVKQVVDEINERTKDFKGMTIPVKIIVDYEEVQDRGRHTHCDSPVAQGGWGL